MTPTRTKNDTSMTRCAGRGVRVAVVMAALVLAGCGSSSTKTNPATPPSTGATTTGASTTATTGGTSSCTIPQNNGADHDADNNGGPNDGDGCDK